jgi:hypothetical protein
MKCVNTCVFAFQRRTLRGSGRWVDRNRTSLPCTLSSSVKPLRRLDISTMRLSPLSYSQEQVCHRSQKAGHFNDEIVPIVIQSRAGMSYVSEGWTFQPLDCPHRHTVKSRYVRGLRRPDISTMRLSPLSYSQGQVCHMSQKAGHFNVEIVPIVIQSRAGVNVWTSIYALNTAVGVFSWGPYMLPGEIRTPQR